MSETFDPDWLDLREAFDALARSEAIAARLIEALPARPRLLDLGAGTGSLLRWLAPRIGRAQAWTLVDADREMAEFAFDTIADRAEAVGWKTTSPNRKTLLVHAPGGAWRIECLTADLAEAPAGLPLWQTDAVVSSALCDLVSEAWLARLAAALRVPFYAALCVDGRDRFSPPDPADGIVAAAFRRDQRRDKGFGGRALGPGAPAAIAAAFAAQGCTVLSAASDWRIAPRGAGLPAYFRPQIEELQRQLAHGHADAAGRQVGFRQQRQTEQWALERLAAAREGRLAVRIGHRDVLALPPGYSAGT